MPVPQTVIDAIGTARDLLLVLIAVGICVIVVYWTVRRRGAGPRAASAAAAK
jgi:hypothetical protein